MREVFAGILCLVCACGPTGGGPEGDGPAGELTGDGDGDGYTREQGDCADSDPSVHPGAEDRTCNGVDEDCNGIIDDPFNADGDLYSTCTGDCDDSDPAVYPGATEVRDGVDNDCDGLIDNHLDDYDDDGDGFTELDGDCDDSEPLVNPGAVEVRERVTGGGRAEPEGADNDCDGAVDEAAATCDGELDRSNTAHYPRAMDLCQWVSSATVTADADPAAKNIAPGFGDVYRPRQGASMAVLSTGRAVDPADPSWVEPEQGTEFDNTASHPDPQPDPADGCGMADPDRVNDYIELTYELDVPTNARALAFDFAFMSAEFPRWVCSAYDDTFLAILESDTFTGNISFDAAGRPVTINIGFFEVCAPDKGPDCTGNDELAGTGFEDYGGTGWLTTRAPVSPGQTIRLRFILFDEGDRRWDSVVLIDRFRWEAEAVDGPVTVPQ